MRHISTQGIVLSRTDFDEAARIISLLTPDQGKVRVLAKGVRKQKSKLAGGIELFSVSDISYLVGRGDIYTLTSTRLVKHYGGIVKDIDRTNAAYEFIKLVNKSTEDVTEPAYFELLQEAFAALDDKKISPDLTKLWFYAHLLKLGGHTPNLQTDEQEEKLQKGKKYNFDFKHYCFTSTAGGKFGPAQIQLLRLAFQAASAKTLQRVSAVEGIFKQPLDLVQVLSRQLL